MSISRVYFQTVTSNMMPEHRSSVLVVTGLLILNGIVYSEAVEFKIRNNLGETIWIGILGNGGKQPLNNGGFVLDPNTEKSVNAEDKWAGRFWARTGCDSNSQHCETGDCGNKLECAGAGGVPPVSLVEITLRGSGDQDFYDVSLVDGFNVPAKIEPQGGTGSCSTVACPVNLNPDCPADLKVYGNGKVIACNSACNKYNRDEDCCRGAYGTPDKCKPPASAQYFKSKCPQAYSYAYDDKSSTFTCKSNAYKITFG